MNKAAELMLVERVLPAFVVQALLQFGALRSAGGMQCRTFHGHAMGRFELTVGCARMARSYAKAMLVLQGGRVIAQGFLQERSGR